MQFAQQQYQNELAKYGKQAGLTGQATDRRASEAQDYNRMVQGLGDAFSTAGYVSEKGMRDLAQKQKSPEKNYQRPEVYDMGPAGGEPEQDPYAKYRLKSREV
jgi:hypothetical protein